MDASTLRWSEAVWTFASTWTSVIASAAGWGAVISSLLVGLTAVTKESKNDHGICSATGHVNVVGSHRAGAVSGGCFNPAVVRSREVACIQVDLGYYLGGRLMCRSLLLVGMKAGTKQSKNYHFIGSATSHVIVAGAHGADAVSRGCKPQHMPLACIVACRSCRRRKASHARRCASLALCRRRLRREPKVALGRATRGKRGWTPRRGAPGVAG